MYKSLTIFIFWILNNILQRMLIIEIKNYYKRNLRKKCTNIRASRYRKINLDIVLCCLNIQDNNRYNIYIQFSIYLKYMFYD